MGGDVFGQVLQFLFKTPNIGHAHAVCEMLKHDLVVGGVAHINPLVEFLFLISACEFFENPLRTMPFIV